MKIISLNIWGGNCRDKLLAFFTDHQEVDVFCLQEVYHKATARVSTDDSPVCLDILDQIGSKLPNHQVYFCPIVDGVYGIAMLVHTRVMVLAHRKHMIHHNPSYVGRGPTHSRFLQHLECEFMQFKINIVNVHGLWNGNGKTDSATRIQQSKNIKDYTNSLMNPVIICGDFNLRPDTESMSILNGGMRNLITENQVLSTRTSLYEKEEKFADYIFISHPLEPAHFEVLTDEVSDHAPLLVDIHVGRRKTKINEEVVNQLIHTQFSDFQVRTISFIGEGWDNFAYEVNESHIFRFPKHKEANLLLQNEINCLQRIHSQLDISSIEIPLPNYVGIPSKEFPYAFCGYKKIPGRSACSFELNETDRIKLAPDLALFMKKLHAIPVIQAQLWEIKGCAEDRMNPSLLIQMISDHLQMLGNRGLLQEDTTAISDFLERFPREIARNEKILLHGDLYARHLVLDEAKKLVGIIDWGDMDIDHPAIDFQIVYTFFPWEGRMKFFEVYGEVDPNILKLAKLRALYSASGIARIGLQVNDGALVKEGLWGLRNLLAVLSKSSERKICTK